MVGGLHGAAVVPILIGLFGITIFVHELGHYLVARLCGLVIEVFSIGFGPAIWRKKHKGVVYKIGCIPFGGYVALPQLDPSGMRVIQSEEGDAGQKTEERRLPRVAAWKKIIVSLAGATGNVLLAVGIAWVVYWVGMPAGPAERSATLGYVAEESLAFREGLRIGDEILSVNGVEVGRWSDFRLQSALSTNVMLDVRSQDGRQRTVTVPTEKGLLGEQAVAGVDGRDLCVVLSTAPDMSAEKAGVESGDTILSFAEQEVWSRAHLIELVGRHADQPVPMVVRRAKDGESMLVTLTVTPELDEALGRPRIGIAFNTAAVDHDTVIRPRPGEQLRHHAMAILRFLRALTTPRQARAASSAVGGPVAIMVSYWFIVKTSLMLAVWFTGFLNVNLAIINLLPIPVLDGGHIVFSLWEMVTRRPANAKFVNVLVNVFAVVLVVLLVLLSIRDVDRFTPWGRRVRSLFAREADTNEVSEVVNEPLVVDPE